MGITLGIKILKFPEREKKIGKKVRIQEWETEGHQIYQQQHQNLDVNRTVIILHLLQNYQSKGCGILYLTKLSSTRVG